MDDALRLTDVGTVRELMLRHGVDFRKSLGQNFLIAESVPPRIAAAVAGLPVLEIGPGVGVLTVELAKVCPAVEAVEIDSRLIPVLDETTAPYPSVRVTNEDFLKLDAAAFLEEKFPSAPYAVAANLPYYITTDVLTRLLLLRRPPEKIVVMVQKEVVSRLSAGPGGEAWGMLGASVACYGQAKKLFDVPRGCFLPPPHVDSAVVLLTRRETPLSLPENAPLGRVIAGAFALRRKTLDKSMASVFPEFSRETVAGLLRGAGIDPSRRGETLTAEELAAISAAMASAAV